MPNNGRIRIQESQKLLDPEHCFPASQFLYMSQFLFRISPFIHCLSPFSSLSLNLVLSYSFFLPSLRASRHLGLPFLLFSSFHFPSFHSFLLPFMFVSCYPWRSLAFENSCPLLILHSYYLRTVRHTLALCNAISPPTSFLYI